MSAKVLLVEDDHEQASLYVQALAVRGYAVEVTDTAEEACTRLAVESFDLLLADWDLGPGRMQGDGLIRHVKAERPEIKTILFSNHMEVSEIGEACGADAALRKEDGIAPLRRTVAELLSPDAGQSA